MKILIVDDHALIRSGLQDMLAEHFDGAEILEAGTVAEASAIAGSHALSLIITDLFIPGEAAFHSIKTLCGNDNLCPVVVLSASDNKQHIRQCIESGCSAYVPKSAPKQTLLNAINIALNGGVYLPEQLRSATEHDGGEEELDLNTMMLKLTQRQIEILGLIAEGKSNKHIAREKNLSENTVKVHVSAILKALKIANRTQAAVIGQKLGLNGSLSPNVHQAPM